MIIFNSAGNLREGIHDWSLAEFDRLLVIGFANSITRPRIASGYSELVAVVANHGLTVEQWLDGSFCTAKVDPGDLDMVTIVDQA